MESQQTKIALYKKRSISDKLGATFDLVKLGWKPLLKYSAYFILPFCILQAFFANTLVNLTIGATGEDVYALAQAMAPSYLGITIACFIIFIFYYPIVYALIKGYDRDDAGSDAAKAELLPLIFKYAKKTALLLLFSIGLGIVCLLLVGGLFAISPIACFAILIPAFFIISVPLSLFIPTYLYEEIGLFAALVKAFRIGFPTWGGTFLLGLINMIIASIFCLIISMPYITVYLIKLMQGASGNVESSWLFSIITFLFCVLYIFGGFLCKALVDISFGYQYGHSSVVADGLKVEEYTEH